MGVSVAKGQIPDKAIASLLQLSQRPAFKKLLYAPPVNWVLVISCLLGFYASFYIAKLWLAGDISAIWMTVLSTYTFFIFLLTSHEGCHLVMARNRTLNDVLTTILTFIPFPHQPVTQWRHQHLTHHRDTCGEEDPDDYLYQGPFWLRAIKLFSHDYYWTYWSFKHRDTAPTSTFWINVASVTVYLSVVVVGLSSAYWYEFIMIYLVPQRIGHGAAMYMFAYVQHPPEKCAVKEISPFKTTAIIRGADSLLGYIYFGQNRHLMHHLYPNMPIYRNWKAWKLGKDIFEKQGLVNVGLNAEHYTRVSAQNDREQFAQLELLQAKITKIETVADGIRSYTLIPTGDSTGFPVFKAGAHIDVVIKPGLVRQYSLCNNAEDVNRYVIAVQCEENGRGGSKTLHETFTEGKVIEISKPRNLFELKQAAEVMLFAGGIGITPMLAMAWTLHRQKIPFQLHYSTATQSKWAFKNSWDDLLFLSSVHVYLDDDDSTTFDAQAVMKGHEKADVYVCGPSGYMRYVESSVKACGLPDDQFNKESFKAGGKQGEGVNRPFTVKLTGSNREFSIPEDRSIVQVLKENGIFIPISCENGVCGTCKCKIVSGDVEHRDMVLNDNEKDEQKLFTPCVSRAKGDVLEIAGCL